MPARTSGEGWVGEWARILSGAAQTAGISREPLSELRERRN